MERTKAISLGDLWPQIQGAVILKLICGYSHHGEQITAYDHGVIIMDRGEVVACSLRFRDSSISRS